jgi:hypothetical protein
VNPELPLLDDDMHLRPLDRVVDRSLAMNAVVYCAHGFVGATVREWLRQEHLLAELTEEEADFVEHADGEEGEEFFWYIDALWALMWTLGKVDSVDAQVQVADDFVYKFPMVIELESSQEFRRSAVLRSREEVFAALDLLYCLHWAIRQREVDGLDPFALPGGIEPDVVIGRRYALEWVLPEEAWGWDEVELDT